MSTFPRSRIALVLTALVALILLPTAAAADGTDFDYEFATPLFGLAADRGGSLFVADYGAGIVELDLRTGAGDLIVELPEVTDVSPLGNDRFIAVTGLGATEGAQKLYGIARGQVREIADLGAFEEAVNPDGGVIDSNPFDLATRRLGRIVVADAGGNDLLVVSPRKQVDWVALFPEQLASTQNAKDLVGCPSPPPDFADICDLPPAIPAQPVPTSVAIGPDGAYYVGELVGFPAPLGTSRVWRIEEGALHAECGVNPACQVVLDGFTSIVDLSFGHDGTLYVVEIDEASWAAVEFGLATQGGTVNACRLGHGCRELATGLPIPTAVAQASNGKVYATILSLVPGQADVVPIP
jgi:hypothetical protein